MSATSNRVTPRILRTATALLMLGIGSACVSNTCNTPECVAENQAASESDSDATTGGGRTGDESMNASNNESNTIVAALEPVGDPRLEAGAVVATVISNGCTRSDDFHLEYAVGDGVCEITIIRDKPDLCRRAPMPVTLTLAADIDTACSESDIVFSNPVLETPAKQLKRRAPDMGDEDTTNGSDEN